MVENINLRVSTPLYAALQEEATARGIPLSEVVRRELRPFIAKTNTPPNEASVALPPLKTKAINVRAEPELAAALDRLAASAGLTKSELLRGWAKEATEQHDGSAKEEAAERKVLMCRVPPSVHKTVRLLAAQRGTTTQDLLEAWVMQALRVAADPSEMAGEELDWSAGPSPAEVNRTALTGYPENT